MLNDADYCEFVSRYKDLCQLLPTEKRKIIQYCRRRHTDNTREKRRKACLAKIYKVHTGNVGISQALKPCFESWIHPQAFLDPFMTSKNKGLVSQLYEELGHIFNRNIADPIRQRIYAVALCRLRDIIDQHSQSSLRAQVISTISQIIFQSSTSDDNLERITQNVWMNIKFGERMIQIADDNGGLGALIVLPLECLECLSLRQ